MNKRNFLKTSGALLTGGLLSRLTADEPELGVRTNWSGNYKYHAQRLHLPKSTEEVQQVVDSCKKLNALGSRHSFNGIADSVTDQISVKNLDKMSLDTRARTVTVGAGLTYGHVAPYLHERGYALHNLASLPHVTVAGACCTGTHGSGVKNGNLSTAVSGLEMVTGNGEVMSLSRKQDGDQFDGYVVSLGGLGVVTNVTLDVQPTFDVAQVVYQNLAFSQLEHHMEEIFSSGYSVSIFTDWKNIQPTQLWIKHRIDPDIPRTFPAEYFGAKLATQNLHPLTNHSAENCTEQMGVPGPWYERLPHFKMNFTPSSGAELQTEYFVPYERGYEAIVAIEQLKDKIYKYLMISELRRIRKDDLWMSPCYQRDSLAIHFTWKYNPLQIKDVTPLIEEKLAPFYPRPHWAKVFTMPAKQVQASYEKLPAFKGLMERRDAQGKFRNQFLDDHLYATA